MPNSSQHQAAGHFARPAAPTTRSLVLVAASLILTACGNSGSLFPPSLGGRTSEPPPASLAGPTSEPPPASLAGPTSEPPPTPPNAVTDNYAPSISGTPPENATVNETYSFKPKAYDPDGDVLTFQVSTLPPWATFNPATGELAGAPPKGWAGKFADIRISVTDGKAKTALPAFTITVTESTSAPTSGTGSATLSWTAPTQNDDGSPLNDLAGYRIYYGTAPENLNQQVEISSPTLTSVEIPGLAAGKWYFAMTATNSAGRESRRTGTVTKLN